MIEVGIVCFEILLVLIGLYLLHWWTSKEADEAHANLQKGMLASETDYLDIMVEAANNSPSLQKNLLVRQL